MATITLEEAQTKLAELIEQVRGGAEIVITRENRPVARLVGTADTTPVRRQLGTMKGSVLYMAPDFDAPLKELDEYMKLPQSTPSSDEPT